MPWLPKGNVSVSDSYCGFKISHWLCLGFPYAVIGIFLAKEKSSQHNIFTNPHAIGSITDKSGEI